MRVNRQTAERLKICEAQNPCTQCLPSTEVVKRRAKTTSATNSMHGGEPLLARRPLPRGARPCAVHITASPPRLSLSQKVRSRHEAAFERIIECIDKLSQTQGGSVGGSTHTARHMHTRTHTHARIRRRHIHTKTYKTHTHTHTRTH